MLDAKGENQISKIWQSFPFIYFSLPNHLPHILDHLTSKCGCWQLLQNSQKLPVASWSNDSKHRWGISPELIGAVNRVLTQSKRHCPAVLMMIDIDCYIHSRSIYWKCIPFCLSYDSLWKVHDVLICILCQHPLCNKGRSAPLETSPRHKRQLSERNLFSHALALAFAFIQEHPLANGLIFYKKLQVFLDSINFNLTVTQLSLVIYSLGGTVGWIKEVRKRKKSKILKLVDLDLNPFLICTSVISCCCCCRNFVPRILYLFGRWNVKPSLICISEEYVIKLPLNIDW